ncbi:hypothetical protein [Ruegeria arenilitoris]|uniref:hypothetical protein n=1 Tax=Ruegeria arenilitoris TaxID=1173585 RepID=UPI00147F370C|nr:hypothetical protein [Ruegeria arenilitoris]
MNYIEQVKAAVEAPGKAVWTVLAISGTILLVDYNWPERFVGLPKSALPLARVIFIVCGCLAFNSVFKALFLLCGWTLKFLRNTLTGVAAPFRRRKIKKKLLNLELGEVVTLSVALANEDRAVNIKPDSEIAISLLDKGLISQTSFIVPNLDGTGSFNIPMEVWRVMISLVEFRLHNPRALLRALGQFGNGRHVLRALPQAHPAVTQKTEASS